MTRHWTRWLPWALGSLGLAPLLPIVALSVVNRDAPQVWTIADPQSSILAIIYSVVGALLAAHRPGNTLGWVFLTIGLLGQTGTLAAHWAVFGLLTQPGTAGGAHALWISLTLAGTVYASSATFPLLLFPGGRLTQLRTRAVALVTVVATTTLALALITGNEAPPGFPSIFGRTPNPLAIDGGPLADPGLAIVIIGLCGIVSIGLLLARFRAARGVTRQQYKWIVLAMAFVVVAVVADFAARAAETPWHVVTNSVQMLGFGLVPAAMAVAVLRYHLWDIDLIISRTLVYAVLSASVVAIYVLIVGWFGTFFHTGGNLLVSLIATGVVAMAFQPLRERLQRGVNSLLYGQRDDPYAVLAGLGRRLEGTLAPEAMLLAIVATVTETLRLPYAAISMRQGGEQVLAATSGASAPALLTLPLSYQGAEVGELHIAPRAGEELGAQDRRLLADLARQAGVAVHAVRLTADLQRSRERIVTAREEERRRLRRDLHDGLGPRLAGLTLRIETARDRLAHDPAADELLGDLSERMEDAVADIRRLVYGLRPPALDDLGLVGAIRQAAGSYDASRLEVVVEAPDTLPALPAATEVAAFRITQEALTNVVRHARAQSCLIVLTLDAESDVLTVTIDDDGVGLPVERREGVGLQSMRERAAELGGTLDVAPRPDGGTRVRADLPCRPVDEGWEQ